MKSLSGKRLLILGGNSETGKFVQVANSLDIHTLVVDPNPTAPAKQFAVEHYEIDGFDVEGIANLARAREVDGVLVGVADVLVNPYMQICQQLQMPCYASKETAAAFSGKDGFKNACQRYGVQDVPGIIIDSEFDDAFLDNFDFPVMVKPVDNGGGVGMRICHAPEEIHQAVKIALSHSRQSKLLVERYMSGDEMFAYYTFKNGKVYLSATADRITTKSQGELSSVCLAARYPSKYTDEFVRGVHPTLLNMFEGIGVRDGVLMIQFFVQNGSFFAYDPGFRLQGEGPHIHLNAINGFDHRTMLINFALTGSMGYEDLDALNDYTLRGHVAGTFWILLKAGKVCEIAGLDEIGMDSNVIAVEKRLAVGDRVEPEMLGTERQVLARIYVVTNSFQELALKAKQLRSQFRVLNEHGNDMVLEWVNPTSLI
jgi:biotin carboxylase